jgi:hypothetical protein
MFECLANKPGENKYPPSANLTGSPPTSFAIFYHAFARFRLGLLIAGVHRYHPTWRLGVRPMHRRSTKGITNPARTLWTLAIWNSLSQVSVNKLLHKWSKPRPTVLIQTPVRLSSLQSGRKNMGQSSHSDRDQGSLW